MGRLKAGKPQKRVGERFAGEMARGVANALGAAVGALLVEVLHRLVG